MKVKILPKRKKTKPLQVVKNRKFTPDGKIEYIYGFKFPVWFVDTRARRSILFSTIGSISLMLITLVFLVPMLSIDFQYWLMTPFPNSTVSLVHATRWGFPFDYFRILSSVPSNYLSYRVDVFALLLSFISFFVLCYVVYLLFSKTGFGSSPYRKGRRSIAIVAVLLFVSIAPAILATNWMEDPIAQMTAGREGWGIGVGTDPTHSALFEQTLKPSISSVYMMGLYMSKDSWFSNRMFRVAFHSQSLPNLLFVEFNTSTINSSSGWNYFSTWNQWVHVTPGNVYMITLSPLAISQPPTPMGAFLYWWGSDASGSSDDKYTDGQNMVWLGDHWYTANDCVPPDTGFQYEDFMFKIYTAGSAPTISLSANPTSINPGNSSTLSWTSTLASSITIDNGIGSVSVPAGTRTVSPTTTTTYTATAVGSGNATSSVTITVNTTSPNHAPSTPSKPTGSSNGVISTSYSFVTHSTDQDNDQIKYRFDWGDGAISDWSTLVNSGDAISMSHSWSTADTYSITAYAKDEHGTPSSAWSTAATIVISSGGQQNGPSITSFTTSKDPVDPEENFQLAWVVEHATTVSISAPGMDTYTTSSQNNHITKSIISNTTFTLLASGVGTPAVLPLTVHVTGGGYPEPTLTMTASKYLVTSGETFTVTWSSTDAATVAIVGGGINTNGNVSGTASVSLTQNTTFAGMATGLNGHTVSTTFTVNVIGSNPPGPGEIGGIPWWIIVLLIILIFVIFNLVYKQYKGDWPPYKYYGASIVSWIKNSEPPEKPKPKQKKITNNKVHDRDKAYYDYIIQYGDRALDQTKYQRRKRKKTMRKKGVKKR